MVNFDVSAELNNYATHLRFLGYEVEVQLQEKVLFATHSRKSNILVQAFQEGALLTSVYKQGPDAARDRLGYLERVNQANQKAAVSRFCVDNDADLSIEAFITGAYSQQGFARFLELWENDFQKLSEIDGIERFLS
mgnify:CR=1 FL=1